MHVLDFSTELQNPEVSVTLLKSDSTTDALQAILKFLKKTKEILAVESVFKFLSVGGLGSSNFLKVTLLKTFF